MKDSDVLKEVKKYFSIHELVGRRTYRKYGEGAWKFLDIRLLHFLLIVRTNLNKKIRVNDWFWGGKLTQRGLRTNVQQLFRTYFVESVLYLSGHVLGKAVDFDVEGMTAAEVRDWILRNRHLFPFKVRLEKGVEWVHADIIQDELKPKIYLFDV